MIVESLAGHWVRLRCADEKDAEFTLAIRNDPEMTRYISRLDNTVSGQREWLSNYRLSDDGCLLIIENYKNKALGTVSFFNIDYVANTCEVGRFISYGTPMENMEALILLKDFLFKEKKFAKLLAYVYVQNKAIINYNLRLGYEVIEEVIIKNSFGEDSKGIKFELTPEKYFINRHKVVSLLEKASQKGL